jgi:hypothetical protein
VGDIVKIEDDNELYIIGGMQHQGNKYEAHLMNKYGKLIKPILINKIEYHGESNERDTLEAIKCFENPSVAKGNNNHSRLKQEPVEKKQKSRRPNKTVKHSSSRNISSKKQKEEETEEDIMQDSDEMTDDKVRDKHHENKRKVNETTFNKNKIGNRR